MRWRSASAVLKRSRLRGRIGVIVLLASVLYAIDGRSASAATVSVSGGVLTFVAADGESNDVLLEVVSQGAPDEFIAVTDRGPVLTAGPGCSPIGADYSPAPPEGAHRADCGSPSA